MTRIRLHGSSRVVVMGSTETVLFSIVVEVHEDGVEHQHLFAAMFPHAEYEYSSDPEEEE